MIPARNFNSRYASTARRTLLARQVALAALVLVPGIACGGSTDASVFESTQTQSTAATTDDTAAATTAAPTPEASSDTAAATIEPVTTEPPATTAAAASSDAFPTTGELAVSFTFAPGSSGGRIENPYVAVWVEDSDGNLVKTISLWYEQSGKGTKYLSDLRQWASSSGRNVDAATSGATRVAGDYTVVWDGTDLTGEPVTQGDYVLYIEAAREHGPYEITSTPITIGTDGFTVSLADDGELTGATAELTV